MISEPAPNPGPAPRHHLALLEALESLSRHVDLEHLFHDLAVRLRKIVEFDFISVLLHDPAENVMRLHVLESEKPLTWIGPTLAPSESPGAP
ncbi:hypothetical protein AYO40_05935 [Planctomycetaceae bacterium SCGC AG-212-D15]|nr:hypothetical protein AYO40_05935 [Planctomycetaceae bacterium SCGC AG-212-D15]